MYFSKKQAEPVQEKETSIWTCENENCSCWMRDNFVFDQTPTCPICDSPMIQNTKVLPVVENMSSLKEA
ncbi:cold-shock protein [Paenibacillus larvae]|uniref:cold-shock protein n=1 Tax=Paenibacillus larvae TaxID=1464 RepID=UPI0028539EB1|nr:cold-shock protein [Paenibacillus larvae]MDR5582862.1 cold-shock protein [Paenibacillus larvae]